MRKPCPIDLSDAGWAYIAPPTCPNSSRTAPGVLPAREILNAIFYIVRSGCAWRLLPDKFPPWETVHHYYLRTWHIDGTWEQLHAALRNRLRVCLKRRDPQPTSAGLVVDSQSVKTTRCRRNTARIRSSWRQESQGQEETPLAGRYRGFGAQIL